MTAHCPGCRCSPPVPAGPQLATCAECGLPVLVAASRTSGHLLMFDPGPDGEGGHYDTVLDDDLLRVRWSGEATAIDCKGRFPLYRAHPRSCPGRGKGSRL